MPGPPAPHLLCFGLFWPRVLRFRDAVRRARHIFSGVNGMSRSADTPARASASPMAFDSAGSEPVTPHSPEPFTPSGFLGDGTGWNSVEIGGRSVARGMA